MPSDTFHCKQFEVFQKGATIKVNTDALCLGAWSHVAPGGNMLDIGSGTGIIALMLAQRQEKQPVIAIEPDMESYHCISRNFMANLWHDRMHTYQMDLDTFIRQSKADSFETIVSNPPYFKSSLLPNDQKKSLAKHMGMLTEEKLAEGIAYLLSPDGYASIIYPGDLMTHFESVCTSFNLFPFRKCYVHSTEQSPVKRIMATFSFDLPKKVNEERLIIYRSKGVFTQQYKSLLHEFLTIF